MSTGSSESEPVLRPVTQQAASLGVKGSGNVCPPHPSTKLVRLDDGFQYCTRCGEQLPEDVTAEPDEETRVLVEDLYQVRAEIKEKKDRENRIELTLKEKGNLAIHRRCIQCPGWFSYIPKRKAGRKPTTCPTCKKENKRKREQRFYRKNVRKVSPAARSKKAETIRGLANRPDWAQEKDAKHGRGL